MGVIRGLGLVLVSTLFFLSVFAMLFSFTIASSLKYDNVKVEFSALLNNLSSTEFGLDQKMNQLLPFMKTFCNTNSEYTFNFENFTFTIPCNVVNQGNAAVVSYGSDELIKKIYYTDYKCNFLDCFGKQQLPLFLVSEQTRVYLISKFYLFLVSSIILLILMLLLAEKKANALILAGISVISAASPLKLIGGVFQGLLGALGSFSGILNVFFSEANFVFVRGLIIGGVILLLGIIFRIFGIELKIYNHIAKLRGQQPKEAVVKEKPKPVNKPVNKQKKK
jgi:hypothetical protein